LARVIEVLTDIAVGDGRTLRVHDTGPGPSQVVVWHHGTPGTGALLAPLVAAAADREMRLVSYDRPGYGGSTAVSNRDVASAADDVAVVADELGLDRFAVIGASGGGPHALACAAGLDTRVTGVACLASPAPYDGDPAWFEGMAAPQALRAAARGRAARAALSPEEAFDEGCFIPADWDALSGPWQELAADAGAAGRTSPAAEVEDDLAYTAPWGFALTAVRAPVLLIQGGADGMIPAHHAERLLRELPRGELWLRPHDGHVSVLSACTVAFDWLRALV
jgi:pimeloyl-ACP methyl ester carboxylesterase